MIIIGILLNLVGLGVLCWALFALAVYALPFFIALTIGMYAYQSGMGLFGAIVVGFGSGFLGLLAGRLVFAAVPSPTVRLCIALLFAVPAACAGYQLTVALAHICFDSPWWREAVAVFGAVVVGCTAWARVAGVVTPAPSPGIGSTSAQSPVAPALGPAAINR